MSAHETANTPPRRGGGEEQYREARTHEKPAGHAATFVSWAHTPGPRVDRTSNDAQMDLEFMTARWRKQSKEGGE